MAEAVVDGRPKPKVEFRVEVFGSQSYIVTLDDVLHRPTELDPRKILEEIMPGYSLFLNRAVGAEAGPAMAFRRGELYIPGFKKDNVWLSVINIKGSENISLSFDHSEEVPLGLVRELANYAADEANYSSANRVIWMDEVLQD